jgi:hypothetical protein
MRNFSLAALAVGSILALAPAAMAQQDQGGFGGAIDQLNRTLNPDAERDRDNQRSRDEDRSQRDRDSRDSTARNDRGSSRYERLSDRDLRDEYSRLDDEQRQVERNLRTVEDEMERRGIRR